MLWGDDPSSLLEEFVGIGGRAVLTCVETSKLDVSWLGRQIDDDFLRDVQGTGIDPCGEPASVAMTVASRNWT